jgi:hypothetical protein
MQEKEKQFMFKKEKVGLRKKEMQSNLKVLDKINKYRKEQIVNKLIFRNQKSEEIKYYILNQDKITQSKMNRNISLGIKFQKRRND